MTPQHRRGWRPPICCWNLHRPQVWSQATRAEATHRPAAAVTSCSHASHRCAIVLVALRAHPGRRPGAGSGAISVLPKPPHTKGRQPRLGTDRRGLRVDKRTTGWVDGPPFGELRAVRCLSQSRIQKRAPRGKWSAKLGIHRLRALTLKAAHGRMRRAARRVT